MSTMHVWFDDSEIDWSPRAVAAPRARRRRRPAGGRRRRSVLTALAAVALAGASAAIELERRDPGSSAPLPATAPAALDVRAAPATSSSADPAVTLQAIAHCESRGNPSAVSPDGRYRGKYQFDLPTWRSVGGTGDPALAPEREQDRRAHALAAARGTQPWPVCGSAARPG